MQLKKLLLVGLLFTLFQGLRGTALADNILGFKNHLIAQQNQSADSPSPETIEPGQNDTLPPIPQPRLSSLILPLPPLLMPDLLLPPYNFPSFNSQRLDQELHLYSRYLRTFGKPDVLIIGSSRALQGIDPIALQEGLAKRGYPGLKVFNFGINGATAQVIDVLLNDILLPEQLPRLVIWGDGSRAFNSGRPDITYNGIIASEGYRRVQQGDRPIPPRSQWMALTLQANQKTSQNASSRPTRPPLPPDLTPNGFEVIPGRFDPQTYFRRFRRVPGQFDGDYQNFQLTGSQLQSTLLVARFAREQQIRLVYVNLPLTEYYLDSLRRRHEQQFRQHMQRVADRHQFTFVDLSQRSELMQNQYFVDPSHINAAGARAMALALAADNRIPWEVVRSSESQTSESQTP